MSEFCNLCVMSLLASTSGDEVVYLVYIRGHFWWCTNKLGLRNCALVYCSFLVQSLTHVSDCWSAAILSSFKTHSVIFQSEHFSPTHAFVFAYLKELPYSNKTPVMNLVGKHCIHGKTYFIPGDTLLYSLLYEKCSDQSYITHKFKMSIS